MEFLIAGLFLGCIGGYSVTAFYYTDRDQDKYIKKIKSDYDYSVMWLHRHLASKESELQFYKTRLEVAEQKIKLDSEA